eukprot:scaffold14161_cov121-Skeletonema_dohrnii-CCMP3373.AAC.1
MSGTAGGYWRWRACVIFWMPANAKSLPTSSDVSLLFDVCVIVMGGVIVPVIASECRPST